MSETALTEEQTERCREIFKRLRPTAEQKIVLDELLVFIGEVMGGRVARPLPRAPSPPSSTGGEIG